MICQTCDGKGLIRTAHIPALGLYNNNPCPECGGCGIAHCCSGDDLPTPPTNEKDESE